MPKLSKELIAHFMCLNIEIDYDRHIKQSLCILGDGPLHTDQCRNRSSAKDFDIFPDLQVIWAIWQDEKRSTSAAHGRLTATLGLLATRLLCASCSKSYLNYFPLVDKWMSLLSLRVCPDSLRDPNHTVFLPWVPAESKTSHLNGASKPLFALEDIGQIHEYTLQDLRRHIEASRDHVFLARLFGMMEELKWMKANEAHWDASSERTAVV